MTTIAKLSNFSASQWRFLANPAKYVAASQSTDRRLAPESTTRQFLTVEDILARLGGCCGEVARKGVLLADDVGLGKTTVAALVAWVFASAGERRSVRILVPNDMMLRRWEAELKAHVALLNICAPHLKNVDAKRIKTAATRRLTAGSIQVVKHSYASKHLACDLLIVDEAHRAKGEGSAFSEAIKAQSKKAQRVLILTATPFSIRLTELNRMLSLVGAGHAHAAVKAFNLALEKIYNASVAHSSDVAAHHLATRAATAMDAISPHVIRHSMEDLPKEKYALGRCEEWKCASPIATDAELELMLRMDRVMRLAKGAGMGLSGASNDARFHVGWQHLDLTVRDLRARLVTLREPERSLIQGHMRHIRQLRQTVGAHSKMRAVADAVRAIVAQGEKVLVFCHHIATAQELTLCLSAGIPALAPPSTLNASVWKTAWRQVFETLAEARQYPDLRDTFINWLCSDMVRAQTQNWFTRSPRSGTDLAQAIRQQAARHARAPTIASAAFSLFRELLHSKSGKAVLRAAASQPELIPGAGSKATGRVLGVCEPYGNAALFVRNRQPDTAIKVFGTPFGPDVLVVTDKLSEGIDLHRYCRHLIHYELDPSPIRTVQRNGRIRRVNSWASVTGEKIRYAYPAFGGTRDQRLVEIMKKRVASFSLLLGGVPDFEGVDLDEASATDEDWRSAVVQRAQRQLKHAGGKLVAGKPGK